MTTLPFPAPLIKPEPKRRTTRTVLAQNLIVREAVEILNVFEELRQMRKRRAAR
jgi:hypothetical protein